VISFRTALDVRSRRVGTGRGVGTTTGYQLAHICHFC
jgi:hypothetical protein